jgi:membrane protease YdiL (CAAX protease family)
MSPETASDIVTLFEYLLCAVGLVLLWRVVLRPKARRAYAAAGPKLLPWETGLSEFLLYVFVIFGAGLFASFGSGLLLSRFNASTDAKTMLSTAAFQLGMLCAVAALPLNLSGLKPDLRGGAVTFLISLPLVTLANLVGLGVLKLTGLPAEEQDLLQLFARANSAPMLATLIFLAVVMAPLTEELLFRATIFRFLRTRTPRWLSLLLPGVVFAALHVNWTNLDGLASLLPLITLAVIFSIAYERTGKIGTAIVAHALFNLHTILLLFAGVTS